jgi:hypothetical protein
MSGRASAGKVLRYSSGLVLTICTIAIVAKLGVCILELTMASTENCSDKLSFPSQLEAEGAAVAAQHKYGGTKQKAYLCKDCEQWHLSTNYETEDLI